MPCNSDYQNPTHAEWESKRACQLLAYALPLIDRVVPEWISIAAKHRYGNKERLNEATVLLCLLCGSMSEAEKDVIIYCGRNAEARKLADWWDEHQKADAARKRYEEKEAAKAKLVASAVEKLTPEERASFAEYVVRKANSVISKPV